MGSELLKCREIPALAGAFILRLPHATRTAIGKKPDLSMGN